MKTTNGIFDQKISLLHASPNEAPKINPVTSCLAFKLLPIFSFIALSLFHVEDSLIATITGIFNIIEFLFIKYVSGYQLVGLKWNIQFPSFSFSWDSKSEPYLPSISNSNFFWMSFFTSMGFWILSFIITLNSSLFKILCSVFCLITELFNLYMFSKAYSFRKTKTEKAVLASIQENVHFEFVPEDENDKVDPETTKENYYLAPTASNPKSTEKKFSTTISDKTTVELPPMLPTSTKQESNLNANNNQDNSKRVDGPNNDIPSDDFY